jgi:hypothetical protein
MGDLRLTREERGVFEASAADRNTRRSLFTFYGSIIIPFLAFGIYGTIRTDFAALVLAFGGLMVFLFWRIGRDLEVFETHKAACKKVVEHERAGESSSGRSII